MLTFQEEGHKYFWDKVQVPSVSFILEHSGLCDDFSKVPENIMERSRLFGKAVHKMTELYDNGTLNFSTVDDVLMPYLHEWQRFKEHYDVKIIDNESKTYSRIWGYAGRVDRIAFVKGKVSVIDIKTSASISKFVGYQTAGYKVLYEEITKHKIGNRYCVQLKKDKYVPEEHTDKNDERVFKSAIMVVKAQLQAGKIKL